MWKRSQSHLCKPRAVPTKRFKKPSSWTRLSNTQWCAAFVSLVAHQPDAEFVVVVTEADALADNPATERFLTSRLTAKLVEVERIVRVMKSNGLAAEYEAATVSPLADESHSQPSLVFVSCTSLASTRAARTTIEDLIIKSDFSFVMPNLYTQVLTNLAQIRDAANRQDISTRLDRAFAPVDSIYTKLGVEPSLCRIILQTLHDLGDMLWIKELDNALLQDTVILDPLLLIDFIRHLFNHKNASQIMPLADFKALSYWLTLRDATQMETMKCVLQAFHLVYADDDNGIMDWDSDLIVPALWQTKPPAARLFRGDILEINPTLSREREAMRVHWEYHVEFGLPAPVFDHVVVASVSPHHAFEAGPDWILYTNGEIAACRLMVGHAPTAMYRIVHVEAVVAAAATAEQVEDLWRRFQQLSGAFVKTLRENPGLRVSSFAEDDKHDKINSKRLLRSNAMPLSTKWMPPVETWEWYKRLLTEQDQHPPLAATGRIFHECTIA